MQEYYRILGLKPGASKAEIKKAFRKLAHIHHPDKKTGDTDRFKKIINAYETLFNGSFVDKENEDQADINQGEDPFTFVVQMGSRIFTIRPTGLDFREDMSPEQRIAVVRKILKDLKRYV